MADVLVSKAVGKLRPKKAVASSQPRKALQVLQVSASDENVLVASPEMMHQYEKKTLQPFGLTLKNSKDGEYGIKERLLRRSKRKNMPSQNEVQETQKEDSPYKSLKLKKAAPSLKLTKVQEASKEDNPHKSRKLIVSKPPKVKKAPKDKESKCEPVNLSQSSLDSYVSFASKSNEVIVPIKREKVSESSIFQDNTIDISVLADQTTMRVVRSTSDEANMLTCDVPDITYWMTLAEQRQIALEIALRENDKLKDESEVLEIENGQLKNTLKELEKVVDLINASLE